MLVYPSGEEVKIGDRVSTALGPGIVVAVIDAHSIECLRWGVDIGGYGMVIYQFEEQGLKQLMGHGGPDGENWWGELEFVCRGQPVSWW
jgi:hypothetical protein